MTAIVEDDYPKGHPARCDYDPNSPEAKEWMRVNCHPKGERDWPIDHPAAIDTVGNKNAVVWTPGVDPHHPDREAFTGRTAEQAKATRAAQQVLMAHARETPVRRAVDAAAIRAAYDEECKRLGVNQLSEEQNLALLTRVGAMPAQSEA